MLHFLRHNWITVAKNFTPSILADGRVRISNLQGEDVKYALYGCTTVRQSCLKCGKARAFTVAGDAR